LGQKNISAVNTLSTIVVGVLLAVGVSNAAIGGTAIELFRKSDYKNALFANNAENYIHFGTMDGAASARANFGYDFHLVSMILSKGPIVSLGIPALIHVYMLPDGSLFHVDNFYAELGIWLQADFNKWFSLRLSPFHHRSSHLADGYMNSKSGDPSYTGNINEDKLSESNEDVYLSGIFRPLEIMEISLGAGYYYHTCSRKNLVSRIDLDFLFNPFSDKTISPVIICKNELLYEGGFRYGLDEMAGVQIRSPSGRGLGVYFRVFNRPHPGRYYYTYEKGVGADIRFLMR